MITSHESSSILHRLYSEQQGAGEEQDSYFPAACLCLDAHNNAVAALSAAPCGLTAALAMQIEAHSLPPPPFPYYFPPPPSNLLPADLGRMHARSQRHGQERARAGELTMAVNKVAGVFRFGAIQTKIARREFD